MRSSPAAAQLARRVRTVSGLLLLLWLLPGGFLFFLAASVTMPVGGSLWAHPAFRDWAAVALALAAAFLFLTLLHRVMAVVSNGADLPDAVSNDPRVP
jgi:hypothetical protein